MRKTIVTLIAALLAVVATGIGVAAAGPASAAPKYTLECC